MMTGIALPVVESYAQVAVIVLNVNGVIVKTKKWIYAVRLWCYFINNNSYRTLKQCAHKYDRRIENIQDWDKM